VQTGDAPYRLIGLFKRAAASDLAPFACPGGHRLIEPPFAKNNAIAWSIAFLVCASVERNFRLSRHATVDPSQERIIGGDRLACHARSHCLSGLPPCGRDQRDVAAVLTCSQCGHGAFIKDGKPSRSPTIAREEQAAERAAFERHASPPEASAGERDIANGQKWPPAKTHQRPPRSVLRVSLF
jgi:hypothetical protein